MNSRVRGKIDDFIANLSVRNTSDWVSIDPSDKEGICNRVFSSDIQTNKYRLYRASPTIECVFFTVDKESKPHYKLEVVFSDNTGTVYELPINSDNIHDLEALERQIITSLKKDFETKITNDLHL